MAGKLYYYDKTSPYQRHLLGEVQATFNMNITLDGTKDSCKVQVLSFSKNQLEPYTICYLDTRNSWWIVSNDKTERHQNESGFFYVHNLQLLGAIELLNARDLTDCGFYQDRYTISEFLQRLIKLSNLEFLTTFNFNNVIDSSETINYIKTYENYTLLSALKDFFNGYNCDIKMRFETINVGQNIYSCVINVYSKTGNINDTILDIDDFDDVRETRKIDKNSYGTQVITNADNVTASKMQVYPIYGGVPLQCDGFYLNDNLSSAYIRLPSNLNNIEWVKMYVGCRLVILVNQNIQSLSSVSFFNYDETSIEYAFNSIVDYVETNYDFGEVIQGQESTIKGYMREIGVATFKKGISVNAYDGSYENPHNLLIPEIHSNTRQNNLFLCEKEVKQALKKPSDGIGYERGSNKIDIDFYGYVGTSNIGFTTASKSFDCGYYRKEVVVGTTPNNETITLRIEYTSVQPYNLRFAVKYEPMGDMKIKVDNELEGNDIQIYNQNGKLTDGNAFSKLLNSYAKEITTDNVTRYMCYYKESDLPRVGQIVDDNGTKYVINSISMTFYENEANSGGTFPYFVDCEITMSKQVAVKSLMVNPNSNIRDYGIPQKHTIKRKQLYRDYCEFDYSSDMTGNDYYTRIDKALTINALGTMYEMSKCLIKTTLANDDNWYYQLDTTRYVLKKTLVTMVDFQDNNIIGYDMQNRWSGFDISKILTPWVLIDITYTPIQYTDDSGSVKTIETTWLTTEQYNELIDNYIDDYDSSKRVFKTNLTSRYFINDEIYETATDNEFIATETNYNKDPLEIPVFEHTFQIGDTPQVEVGSDIFTIHKEGWFNLFGFELVDKNKINEFNALQYSTHDITRIEAFGIPVGMSLSQNATFQFVGQGNGAMALYVSLYENYDSTHDPEHYNKITSIPTNKDLAIYRYEYDLTNDITIKTLMFIIHLDSNTPISLTNDIILYAHQYKLK